MEKSTAALLYLSGNLFRIYVIYRFFKLFFEKAYRRNTLILAAYAAYFILNSLAFLLLESPYINLFTNLFCTFLLTYFYDARLRMRLLAVLMIYAINLTCEEIIYRISLAVNSAETLTVSIIAPNLLLLPLVLSFGKLIDLKFGQRVSFVEWICMIFVPILSIFILSFAFNGNADDTMAAIATAGLLVMNILVFHLFDHISSGYQKEYELAFQRQQNEAYENQLRLQKKADRQMEVFRHDIKNHLIALQSLAEFKDNDGLVSYINEMTTFVQKPELLIYSGNTVIDSILNIKLQQAKEMGAEISTEVNLPEQVPVSPLDLNIILANLLDNAIQALQSCSIKQLFVSVTYDKNVLYIEIENTYKEKLLTKGSKLLTTKKEKAGHGVGLSSVEQAAARYEGHVEVEHTETMFTVSVLLYCFSQQENYIIKQ